MTRLTTLFSTAFVLLAGNVASADTYDHFDQIAHRIERQATELVREVRHFRHTRQYGHLAQDAVALMRSARHAHNTAHVGCDLGHLEVDVREMDRLVHHIEDLLDDIEHSIIHGHGHAHGNARHVRQVLHAIEDNVHHLWDDLRALRRPGRHVTSRPAPTWNNSPYYNSPQTNWRSNSPRVRVEVNGHGHATSHRNSNAVSRRVPAGWGNSSVPRFRFGFGF